MIKNQITCGVGTGKSARVLPDHELLVSNVAHPPLMPQKVKVFRQHLTDDGLSTGSEDMLVDGSVTPVEFWVPAATDADRYITTVSFVIGDAGAELDLFGTVAALANGCDFEYERSTETVTIHGALKTNWDFVRLCFGTPAFGSAAEAFRAKDVEGGTEAYIPVFDFVRVLPPYGLKLDMGTREKLILRVNDDCTGPDVFNAIAYGFDRFE